MYIGVDVSEHNGDIIWGEVRNKINFAIIRAGYGAGNIDKQAAKNINGCIKNNIPFGLYWFSYALNETAAKNEANYLCDIADKFNPSLPLVFDYEYDSDEYFKRKYGIPQTDIKRKLIAKAFLDRVDQRGYTPMLYTNLDYLTKGFADLQNLYPLWLAQWGDKTPTIKFDIWQKTNKAKISGINGNVDLNETEKKYVTKNVTANWKKAIENIDESVWEEYYKIALDIINGKYGVGENRKSIISQMGKDYKIAQSIVNWLLK